MSIICNGIVEKSDEREFFFPRRERIGQTVCDCETVIEIHEAWLGWRWEHHPDCALLRLIAKKPQLMNLPCYQHLPVIATAE